MSNPRLLLAGLLAAAASVALACGPDFPEQLLDDRATTLKATPVNSFAFEAAHLVARPADALIAVEPESHWGDGREARRQALAKAEADRLSPDQAGLVQHMRGAETGDTAFAGGTDLPAAIRLYTAGAVDFHQGHLAEAASRFQAVLRLPDQAQQSRSVWAGYMLGRIAARDGDAAKAAAEFARVRALATAGAPDPLGLAVAAYGEEAKLHLDRASRSLTGGVLPPDAAPLYGSEIAAAVALYGEQAARGSDSGVQSLRIVAEQLRTNPAKLDAAIGDPAVQRLLVAYVLARVDDIAQQPYRPDAGVGQARVTPNPLLGTLVDAIARHGIEHPPGADRLAALAYRMGRYDLARRLAGMTPGPLAAWVKAKLALQKGDLAEAAGFYAEAAKAFPAGDDTTLDDGNTQLLTGEGGVLALARGEYVDALKRLYPVANTYWGDVAYIAERVLTVDELKSFVDAEVPEPPQAALVKEGTDNVDSPPPATPAARLRDLLARRLVREGRYADAFAYVRDLDRRQDIADYAEALRDAERGWWRVERARALYTAALLARQSGMEMMGTEAAPDYYVYGGDFETGLGRDTLEGPLITEGERRRFAESVAEPALRFHYRYIAVDEASRAADLLPPRSQAFAAVLCQATGWMMSTRGAEGRVHALYARYLKQGAHVSWAAHFGTDCPEPDFDAAATFAYRQYLRDARHTASQYRWPLGAGLVVFGLGAVWLARRRGSASAA